MVKASACNAGDLGSIPGSGRSPGKGMATHSSILAWEIPWMEKPGRLQSMAKSRTQLKQLSSSSSKFKNKDDNHKLKHYTVTKVII